MDWMTLLIELTGFAVLVTFVVVPVQEFRQIFAKLRREGNFPRADDHGGNTSERE